MRKSIIGKILRFLTASSIVFTKYIVINGTLTEPTEPTIYAVNHTTLLDGPIMGTILYFLRESPYYLVSNRFYTGKGLSQPAGWLSGWYLRHTGRCIPVKCKNVIESALHVLTGGNSLVVFPEGRINKKLGKFKPGVIYLAKKANVRIVPVAMKTIKHWPLYKKVVVNFGKPWYTIDSTSEELKRLKNKIQNLFKEIK